MKKWEILILVIFMLFVVGCGKKPNGSDSGNSNKPTEQEKQKFLITFIDEKNNTLASSEWDESSIPSYSYTVNDTDEWDYTFEGWAKESSGEVLNVLPQVVEAANYYAIVSKVKKTYTLSFDSKGGSETSSITLEYGSLVEEPAEPTMENHKFMGWSTSETKIEEVKWPIELKSNITVYAVWNEVVDIKGYLSSLVNGIEISPSSFIPETMLCTNIKNHVSKEDVDYNFTQFTNVSDIKYGGFGDQWNMVLNNINQSEMFYNVLTSCELLINSSVVLFNNYLDKNMDNTASHQIGNSEYSAKIEFKDGLLEYTIQLETSLQIPLIGGVEPQIHMELDVETGERSVRIQLNNENAILYKAVEDEYSFFIEYGIEQISRKAAFLVKRVDEKISGHIYEFVKLKDSDVVPSSAQFYIDDEYVSVVGNKAQSITMFDGYINELYSSASGKLLGFEVRETLTFASVTKQYDTLWFNLNGFSGFTSIKAIKNDNALSLTSTKNAHDIYVNGSSKIFKPMYNKVLMVETSRKYDIELRNQYFYGYKDQELVEYKTEIPMLFVQAEDLDELVEYLKSYNEISTTFSLNTKIIEKIQYDYDELIDAFIEVKNLITSQMIDEEIGDTIIFK